MRTFATTHCGLVPSGGRRYFFGSKMHHASGGTELLMRKYRAVVPVFGCPTMTILNERPLLRVAPAPSVTQGESHCRAPFLISRTWRGN